MLALLATLCCGLFAGAAGYVSLVEHWARLQAGPEVALAQFRAGFARARAGQASLAMVGALSSFAAWATGGGAAWLGVATLLAVIVGFTLVRITPVYNRLLDASLTAESPGTVALLERWGRLHAVRSALGLAAFVLAAASL